ncbi:MAG: protein translocase subunit SecD, partial [Clostridia bacterium]|nr:protein translocase subunit SecD [Clostridia bacterium]
MKPKKKEGRKKSIILLAILGVFLILFSVLTVMPYSFGIKEYKPVIDNISLGIDLRGGVYMVLEADGTDENGDVIPADEFNRSLDGTISTLTSRLVGKGFTESTVVRQGEKRIRIEIPDVDDPESVFEIIGKPAVLQFRDDSGKVLLEGSKHLQSAFPTYDENGSPAVGLNLNDEGTSLFAEATRNNEGKTISIYIDEDEVSKPNVQQEIANGKPIITNIGTMQQAEDFAMLLQSGALPLKMNEFEKGTVSPTLGQDALKSGIIAGLIGLALVMVFMCVYYKGLG